ncbi:MAG: hypothetical protein IPF93_14560 [Saprospiraceae bacterium]|nr:hypothetical protein [Saprospiraceae bacterium]
MKDLTAQSLGLSLVVAENNIKDAQLTPTGVDTNYIHRHVMRSFCHRHPGRCHPTHSLRSF